MTSTVASPHFGACVFFYITSRSLLSAGRRLRAAGGGNGLSGSKGLRALVSVERYANGFSVFLGGAWFSMIAQRVGWV